MERGAGGGGDEVQICEEKGVRLCLKGITLTLRGWGLQSSFCRLGSGEVKLNSRVLDVRCEC